MTQIGFPHSDMVGSQPAHGSPTLFAVYHVLRRLLAPRHPPFAFGHFLSHAENTTAFETPLLGSKPCPSHRGSGRLLTATRREQPARVLNLCSKMRSFYSVVNVHADG